MKAFIALALLLSACVDKQELGGTTHDVFTGTRWALTLGSIGADEATGVALDSVGDVVAVGDFTGTVDFGITTIPTDHRTTFLTKRAGADGTERWTQTIGLAPGAVTSPSDIVLAPDDSIVVAGLYGGDLQIEQQVLHGPPPTTGGDCFVAKYDHDGHFQWLRGLGAPSTCSNNKIAVGNDGRVAMSGTYQGTLVFPNGTFTATGSDPFLVVFDSDGTILWGAVGAKGMSAGAVAMTPENDVVVTGQINDHAEYNGMLMIANALASQYVARWTIDGHLLWIGQLGTAGISQYAGPIVADPQGAAILASTAHLDGNLYDNGKPLITELDPTGHAVWTVEAASGSVYASAFTRMPSGTVVVGGFTSGFEIDFGNGTLHNCLAFGAYSSSGAIADSIGFGNQLLGCQQLFPSALASAAHSIVFAGYLRAAADFGTGTVRFAGDADAMIVMLDTNE